MAACDLLTDGELHSLARAATAGGCGNADVQRLLRHLAALHTAADLHVRQALASARHGGFNGGTISYIAHQLGVLEDPASLPTSIEF